MHFIGTKDLDSVFSSECRFFLRDAEDRLLAPQNDNSTAFFRSTFILSSGWPKWQGKRAVTISIYPHPAGPLRGE
jgi:hypothetical protein